MFGLVVMMATAIGGAWLMDASIDKSQDESLSPSLGRAALSSVRSWGYQLQDLRVDRIASSSHDLIVVDERLDGHRSATEMRVPAELRRKPNGARRIVLSYLSLGEAEDHRHYWSTSWTAPANATTDPLRLIALPPRGHAPAHANFRFAAGQSGAPLLTPTAAAPVWLGSENPDWRGNYNVRFWHPDWKDLIYGKPSAAVDRIVAAGFDGIYLDRADVYNLWRHEQASSKSDMIDLVAEIAAYARQKKPDFLIVLQSTGELLADKRLRHVLDGVAKEDLLYDLEAERRATTARDAQSSMQYLRQARTEGLPVLALEYVSNLTDISAARNLIESEGFIASFGPRALNLVTHQN